MSHPKLTYVIASRNDNYCGDNLSRLDQTIDRIHSIQETAEVIIVDWGSESNQRISYNLWPHQQRECRTIYIPPSITTQYPTPFNEVLALNIGIRRAKGEWIARLDQDILVGERFVNWFENMERQSIGEYDPAPETAYFSLRRDLSYTPMSGDQTDIFTEAPVWQNWSIDSLNYFMGAVGILLAPRSAWFHVRGYDERLIYRNHMEHDLCLRFKTYCGLVNLGLITNCDFCHQWHERIENRPTNEMIDLEILKNSPLQANSPNWGLGDQEFEEV